MKFSIRAWTLLVFLAAILSVAGYHYSKGLSLRTVHAAGAVGPQPIQFPGFPFPATTIDGWVASGNTASMRAHGWGLWSGLGAITASSGGLPIYETWYNNNQVQSGPTQAHALLAKRVDGHPQRQFEVPEQFHHRRFGLAAPNNKVGGAVDVHAQILVTTTFDADYAESVWSNSYQNTATIWNLQANWGTRPVVQRVIKPFTAPSISTKPVYQFVNGPNHNKGLTTVKYWLGDLSTGPNNSSNPKFPTPNTWNQCVVVNTGSAPNPGNLTCFGTSTPANGMVPVSAFYNYQLTAAEATAVCQQFPKPCGVEAGDYAILVAMHVSTKENANWTWQTFWWNYSQPFPYGAPPNTVAAPFNHYAMCTGYSMTVNPPNNPSGTNTLCYNPYLETGLGPAVQGINSDCMSCHSVASIGNNPNSLGSGASPRNSFGYPTFASGTSYISVYNPADDKVFFDCQTTTDFSWFLATYVGGSPPSSQAPCVLTALRKPAPRKK